MDARRVTLLFPPAQHQQVVLTAQHEGKSLSEFVRDAVDYVITLKKQAHRQEMYNGLERLAGTGSPNITDASTTIDDTLYGENGVWRGQHGK